MTHGSRNNDCYRERTQQIVPAIVSGRTTCTNCGKHQSDGQFPLGSAVCVTCAPQGPNFRRGQIETVKANFQEITMDIEEKALRMIGGGEPIRSMQLIDRLNMELADLEPVLTKLIKEGKIVAQQVTAPNGRPATAYMMTDQARSDAREAAPGVPMDTGSKIETAIRYLRANDGATASQLHSLLGLAANDLVSRELAPALADGRLVKNGKDWSIGAPVAPAPPAVEPEPVAPAPHRTKPQMALDYLKTMPHQQCTQEQMRVALDLPKGGQPAPYLKSMLDNGRVRRVGTDWMLAPAADGSATPAPLPAAFPGAPKPQLDLIKHHPALPIPEPLQAVEPAPATAPDEHEALTFAPLGSIGDVNSTEKGSGARFNGGKPDYSLIPMATLEGEALVWGYGAKKYAAWNWTKGMAWSVPFACAMRHMAAWQRGEDLDPESGLPHLAHVACNIRMLTLYAVNFKEGDDRPSGVMA